jgi:hypothetical protein
MGGPIGRQLNADTGRYEWPSPRDKLNWWQEQWGKFVGFRQQQRQPAQQPLPQQALLSYVPRPTPPLRQTTAPRNAAGQQVPTRQRSPLVPPFAQILPSTYLERPSTGSTPSIPQQPAPVMPAPAQPALPSSIRRSETSSEVLQRLKGYNPDYIRTAMNYVNYLGGQPVAAQPQVPMPQKPLPAMPASAQPVVSPSIWRPQSSPAIAFQNLQGYSQEHLLAAANYANYTGRQSAQPLPPQVSAKVVQHQAATAYPSRLQPALLQHQPMSVSVNNTANPSVMPAANLIDNVHLNNQGQSPRPLPNAAHFPVPAIMQRNSVAEHIDYFNSLARHKT